MILTLDVWAIRDPEQAVEGSRHAGWRDRDVRAHLNLHETELLEAISTISTSFEGMSISLRCLYLLSALANKIRLPYLQPLFVKQSDTVTAPIERRRFSKCNGGQNPDAPPIFKASSERSWSEHGLALMQERPLSLKPLSIGIARERVKGIRHGAEVGLLGWQ